MGPTSTGRRQSDFYVLQECNNWGFELKYSVLVLLWCDNVITYVYPVTNTCFFLHRQSVDQLK